MPLTEIRGDLFANPLPAIGHGCNCAGSMGKGIAVDFKRRFPKMYVEYKKRCQDGRFQLGALFVWEDTDTVIYNLGTQTHWKAGAELWAVESAVKFMIADAEARGLDTVGLPRIAAGLGSLEWSQVKAVLSSLGQQTKIKIVVFEYVPSLR